MRPDAGPPNSLGSLVTQVSLHKSLFPSVHGDTLKDEPLLLNWCGEKSYSYQLAGLGISNVQRNYPNWNLVSAPTN